MHKSNNSIGIHYIGLTTKEHTLFNRVIAFNVTHGLATHNCDDVQSSDLIISAEASVSQIEQVLENQKVLVIADNASCNLGDIQIKRPILITRVMKALETVVDQVKLEQNKVAEPEAEDSLIDLIDAVDIDGDADSDIINETTDIKEDSSTKVTSNDDQNDFIAEEPAIENHHSGHHALVIDDSAAIRKQLELELRDAGISADFAESGEQALEKIEDTQYDLVFLDIIMPGIDGYETCRAMRAKASYKKTPIIMLSGKTSPLDEVQGVIAGATTYLTKPVKSKMLQETLARVTKWIDNFAVTNTKKDSATV